MKHAEASSDVLGIKNHKKVKNFPIKSENIYKFTIKTISLSFINSLFSDPRVKDIFYNASFTPPGGSFDSISLRYKVYVEYY